MASLDGGFNAQEVEPSQGFDVLPAGEYRVCVVGSEMKPTKKGDGQLLNLQLQVLDGQYQNRRIFERINWINPNPTAQQIGRGTLSAICRAVGVLTPNDTSELHNKPLRAKVKVKNDPQYGEQNEVVKYSQDKTGPVTEQSQSQGGGSASAWAQTMGN